MNPGLLLMFGATLIVLTLAACAADLIDWMIRVIRERKER